jgi:Carboxypeptidase regulatory-like domain
MKKVFTSILLVAISITSNAQSNLSGTIEAENKAVITAATVNVKSKQTNKSVTSNETGNFLLEALPKGLYSISITSVGYEQILK